MNTCKLNRRARFADHFNPVFCSPGFSNLDGNNSGSKPGFTIVEIVLAMGILLLGMTAVVGLFSFGGGLSRAAELRSLGAAHIEALMADLEEQLFPLEDGDFLGPAQEPPEILEGELPSGIRYRAETTPNPDQLSWPDGPLEYRVDVELFWRTAGEQKRRRFTTVLLREVPFGERLRRQFVESDSSRN